MLVEDLGMETGIFFPRKGIGEPPYGVQFLGYLDVGSFFGPFKDHVFNEVGYTVFLLRFVT